MEPESVVLAARAQMALTLAFHIVFSCIGIGMPVLMVAAEALGMRRRDPLWTTLARRWSRAFAVLFAVGAVSGTVLSFELGLLWPELMERFGPVMGIAFTLEGFAFFLEAIFAGVYLYGWGRIGPRAHLAAGIPIALSGLASAVFVVSVNAWMNTPQGFRLDAAGRLAQVSAWQAFWTPAAPTEIVHTVLSCYIVAGLGVAAVHALALLGGAPSRYHRRALALALALGLGAVPLQIASGDRAAKFVARVEPVKLAAMEGQYRTERRAPLRIGGLPDDRARTTRFAIEIPGMLSWLAYGDRDAEVKGLDAFPRDETPPTAIVHLAFQAMVGLGSALLALLGWVAVAWFRRRELPRSRSFYAAVAASGPAAVIAMEAGWFVTEVGRQPWVVRPNPAIGWPGMRVAEGATAVPGVGLTLIGVVLVYAVLTVGCALVLRRLAREPLAAGGKEAATGG